MIKVSTLIPFSGFYESWHDDMFDRAMEQMFDPEGCGAAWAGPLQNRFSDTVNWRAAHTEYAKDYAETFAKELGLKTCGFEEMTSPREYNFSTDRIFAKLDLSELKNLFERVDVRAELDSVDADMFTSRDGFMSFYSPAVPTWGVIDKWDANQFGALVKAAANVVICDGDEFDREQEFRLMEDASGNGHIDNWIWGNTSDCAALGNRCDRIATYLNTRAQR